MLDVDKVVSKLINLSEQKFTLLEDLMSLTEKQTGDILREICDIEKKNKEKMLKAKDALQEKIYSASKGKRAIQQYGNFDSYTDAYFIDRKIK